MELILLILSNTIVDAECFEVGCATNSCIQELRERSGGINTTYPQ